MTSHPDIVSDYTVNLYAETTQAIVGPVEIAAPAVATPGPRLTDSATSKKAKRPFRRVYECERCGRFTYLKLSRDGQCTKCQRLPPDISVKEIYRRAAEIRKQRRGRWPNGEHDHDESQSEEGTV